MVNESVLNSVRNYLRALQNQGVVVKFGIVFGSQVAGNTDIWSDIDLLVDINTDVTGLLPVLRMNDALRELLGFAVDVSPADLLRPEFAASVQAQAVPL